MSSLSLPVHLKPVYWNGLIATALLLPKQPSHQPEGALNQGDNDTG